MNQLFPHYPNQAMKSIINSTTERMKLWTILILLFTASATIAQTQKQPVKPENKPAATSKPAANENQNQQKLSPLTEHYYKKYITAMQWSDYEVAKDALYDLIIENPQNDSLIFTLAYYYFDNQKYVPAVLISQQLLARNPKDVNALEMSAVGYEVMGVPDRSLQNYESLFLLTGNLAMLYKMAFLQFDLKRYAECLSSIDILLKNKDSETLKVVFNDVENKPKEYPMKVSVLNLKGLATQDHFGDKEAAKKAFEEALAIAPDFVPAKQNLAKVK
jgi:tetratricopeptide (TPR) repeat protein